MTKVLFNIGQDTIYGVRGVDTLVTAKAATRRVSGDLLITRDQLRETDSKPFTIDLAPTALGQAWIITVSPDNGDSFSGYYKVPAGDTVNFTDLIEVDPESLEAVDVPDPEWWAVANSTVNSGKVVNDHLILTRNDGVEVDAGNVRGLPGKDGADGAPGRDGDDGVNGLPGADGVSVVYTEIDSDGDLLVTLSNDQVVNAGRAKGGAGYTPFISVKDFGALGDGISDDTTAINSAIASSSGATLNFPSGHYIISNIHVNVSDIEINFEPGAKIISMSQGDIISVSGVAGSEIAIAENLTNGDTVISTSTAHGLTIGDSIQLVSQRDSLSADAGDEWRLGYATPGSQGCYFAEFHEVGSVESETAFTVRQPILFPSYRVDSAQETSVSARANASIRKIDFVENVKISNLTIECGGTAIRTRWAENTQINNMAYSCNRDVGAAILFQDSLNSCANNASASYNSKLLPEIDHHRRNSFKTAGSHNCGFVNCKSVNGTQPIDFSYFGGGTPSVHCYAIGNELRASQSNGLTTHGGTYGARIIGNYFYGMKHGPSIRTRNSVIANNYIEGSGLADSMGIYLYEGWARDCVVSNNVIVNMDIGISISDAADIDEVFTYVGASITGNNISKCRIGIRTRRSLVNKFTGETGINIEGNTISMKAISPVNMGGIVIDKYTKSPRISGNIIRSESPSATSNGILLVSNSSHAYIENNQIIDTYIGVRVEAKTDSAISLDGRVYASRNHITIVSSSRRYVLETGVNLWDAGFFGESFRTRGVNPGSATGTDASVINSLITTLRSMGVIQ